jgi:hypothetical protein
MVDPDSLRHQLYRDLYLSERARRERICASAGLPVAALAVTVLALASVLPGIDLTAWRQPATAGVVALVAAAMVCVIGAGMNVIRIERPAALSQLPDLDDLRAIEASTRRLMAESGRDDRALIAEHFRGRLTDTYFAAFREQQRGNGLSAARRAAALRLSVLGLILLSAACIALPLQRLIGST